MKILTLLTYPIQSILLACVTTKLNNFQFHKEAAIFYFSLILLMLPQLSRNSFAFHPLLFNFTNLNLLIFQTQPLTFDIYSHHQQPFHHLCPISNQLGLHSIVQMLMKFILIYIALCLI